MQRIIATLFLIMAAGVQTARAQLQVEVVPQIGYPFMLSGRNNKDFGSLTGRLQVSYKTSGLLQPYLATSLSPMELPLHNKEIKTLTLAVLNTSFKAGMNTVIRNNEATRSLWIAGGGIGICMLRPDEATLRSEGRETAQGYTSRSGTAWFPQMELGLRWIRYPKPELHWYFGVQFFAEGIWLKDKVRYTTDIAGTQYNLSFNDIVVWPSLGAVIGWSF